MYYQLILREPEGKDFEDNVILDNLSSDYKVYLFYYPGINHDREIADKLRKLGKITGKNLLVNIGELDDPAYDLISSKFEIKRLPVIIMTARSQLASDSNLFRTVYIRIDSKKIFESSDTMLELVQQLFNLFIQGEISDAMKHYELEKIKFYIKHSIEGILDLFKGLIKEKDIAISFLKGSIELKSHM